jgi:hypothetical protein
MAKTEKLIERAASMVADGQVVGFERLAQQVTPNLAYIVEIERFRGKVGGSAEPSSLDLRVTSVFGPGTAPGRLYTDMRTRLQRHGR